MRWVFSDYFAFRQSVSFHSSLINQLICLFMNHWRYLWPLRLSASSNKTLKIFFCWSRWPCGLRSKVCGRSIAEIAGSNTSVVMDICLLWTSWVLSCRSLCDGPITRSEGSYRLCVYHWLISSATIHQQQQQQQVGKKRPGLRKKEKLIILLLQQSRPPGVFRI